MRRKLPYDKSEIPRLFEMMEERGITQAKMAEISGIAQSNIHGWRTGLYKPSAEVLSKIADRLGTSTDYLLGKSEIKYHSDAPELSLTEEERYVLRLAKSPEKYELMKMILSLTPEEDKLMRSFLALLRTEQNPK